MATLLEIKTLAASYLDLSPSDFTVNGMDLFLAAANQVRKTAELEHDFEFNRKSVTVTVNGTTGGNLETAIDSSSSLVDVKTVIEVGFVDEQGNLLPTTWTTTAESLERQRQDNQGYQGRLWRGDAEGDFRVNGGNRFTFSGSEIWRWPLEEETASENYSIRLEAYCFTPDWDITDLSPNQVVVSGSLEPDITGNFGLVGDGIDAGGIYNFYLKSTSPIAYLTHRDIDWLIEIPGVSENWTLTTMDGAVTGSYTPNNGASGTATVLAATVATSDVWTTHGQQFLLWATIVQLNKRYKFFVPRQEGNLPPPTELADAGLQMLVDWDGYKYEQFRRHNR